MNRISLPLLLASLALAGNSERIRINQVGFAVGAPKLAIALDSGTARLIDSATRSVVLEAHLSKGVSWSKAGDTGRVFDFSAVERPGTYYVVVGREESHPVRISAAPFLGLSRDLLRAYWLTRASYSPASPWAGPYARPAGHPDTAVRIHASAATAKRPKNSTIRSPGGWYDAGDYGKYVVNSGITTWTLLRLYETSAAFFDTLDLGVPPHPGPASDLLDEILWNLRWMLSMQDPDDGGVYHKLTSAQHAGFVMPGKDVMARYVVQKSTTATLDMAAVAAFASRILRGSTSKALADSCLTAAVAAWRWARANPDSIYNQDSLNERYYPAIGTGTYDDVDPSDEFQWAASELSLATGSDSFATAVGLPARIKASTSWSTLGWEHTGTMGLLSLAAHREMLPGALSGLGPALDSGLLRTVRPLAKPRATSAYHLNQVYFWWGSAGNQANIGLLMWEAWRITGDTALRNASLDALDYVLGRNATGYSFVTGFGAATPLHPHNRITESDTVDAPIPGLVVGGPNETAAKDDGCDYWSEFEAKLYVDDVCSYSTNENSINQAAPVAYLAGAWSALGASASEGASPRVRVSKALATRLRPGSLEVSAGEAEIVRLEIVSPDGRIVATAKGGRIALDLLPSGSSVILARDASGTIRSTKFVLP